MAVKKILIQLIRRWRVQAYLDFMWMTRDFTFFFINVVSDIIINLAGIMAVFLLAERFEGIGSWTRDQILFMLGYAAVVRGLLDMGFSYNVLYISRRIGRGQMDHTLIQPQPIWMALLTEGFMPFSGSWSLLAGLGLTAYACAQLDLSFSLGWWLWFGCHLLSSCAIVLSFSFLWGSLAFWSPVGAEEISSRAMHFVHQLKPFPLDGLSPFLMNALLSVLPVGFVAWYPCRALLSADAQMWKTPLAAITLSLLAFWAFQKGLKYYGKTGSQRYLGWGHRG